MSLQGKVALVTGGSNKSLGADSARKLAQQGVQLALHYDSAKSRDNTCLFRDELQRSHRGIKVSVHGGDLSTAAAVEQLLDDVVTQHRRVDIVV